MATTLAVRFPLGRYHATPWDRSVNEGAVEWPPSPWRVLRALVSTWYTRWPQLPAPVLDGILSTVGSPPVYWTAPAKPGHTRHYLPDAGHRSDRTGGTDLALDPFLALPRDDDPHLLIRWEADLTGEQREALRKLAELVPYLGRAESVCEVTLLDTSPEPDETWWRPNVEGDTHVRLLSPAAPISRPLLEVRTVDVRKARRTQPPGTVWVSYSRTTPEPAAPVAAPGGSRVAAIRFAVHSRAPFRATHGVLLADTMHRAVTKRLDGGRVELLGHGGATTNHTHAHWVPLSSDDEVDGLLVWAPVGITAGEVAAIIGTRWLSGQRGDYDVKGFPKTTLLLQSIGEIDEVAPELCAASRVWTSHTPYLPVRHHKRGRVPFDEFLADDVRRELRHRDLPDDVTVTRVPSSERWALRFRRYREGDQLSRDVRPGFGLRLTFTQPRRGPLMLGQLSHFGFGVFVPETAP